MRLTFWFFTIKKKIFIEKKIIYQKKTFNYENTFNFLAYNKNNDIFNCVWHNLSFIFDSSLSNPAEHYLNAANVIYFSCNLHGLTYFYLKQNISKNKNALF